MESGKKEPRGPSPFSSGEVSFEEEVETERMLSSGSACVLGVHALLLAR